MGDVSTTKRAAEGARRQHCPAWCVTEHSDDEHRTVVEHQGQEEPVPDWTLSVGAGAPGQPETMRLTRVTRPDGSVVREGLLLGEKFLGADEARKLLARLANLRHGRN
jgi:hypothetical protein